MNRWLAFGWLLVFAGALSLRLPQLDRRPMHNDEAINASTLQGLWEKGVYRYSPQEYHGPALYYLSLPVLWLSGVSEFSQVSERTLRLAPVFFGAGLVLLLVLLADGLGRPAAFWAGLFTAVSPAMVFYSRYYIHEMLLVCATLLLLAAGWRYFQTRRTGWAILAGVGLGLMYAAKETFVLALGAMAAAGLLTALWARRDRISSKQVYGRPDWRQTVALHAKPVLAGLIVAAAVSLLLFTSFLSNPSGPADSIRSYLPWLHRAGGHSPHVHPWYFYFQRLAFYHPPRSPVWSEGLILVLALAGVFTAFRPRALPGVHPGLIRFIALYTVFLTLAYSFIAYKTPWCLLGFFDGMILLAGVGAVALLRLMKARWLQVLVGIVLLLGTAHLGWQAWRASYPYAADRRNPYVYAQTSPNALELVAKVAAIAQVHPDKTGVMLKVISPESYWPLPWYLRQFKRVGWYDQVPADPYAPIMIVSSRLGAAFDEKSNKAWLMVGLFELRPRLFYELYVNFDLWRKYVETLPPPKDE